MHEVQSGGTEDDGRQRELESRAAGIKAVRTWHATATIQTCREACGGAGYLAENRLPQLKADTDVFTTFEGDNTVLLQLVAKGLLTSYRDHVGELDTLGMVRFVADQVVEQVVERTSARASTLAAAGPDGRRRACWTAAGSSRCSSSGRAHLLAGSPAGCAGRRPDDDPFKTFNAAQDHLLRRPARTWTASCWRPSSTPSPAARTGAPRCSTGCATSTRWPTIEADRGWFLEHGGYTARRRRSPGRSTSCAVSCARMRARWSTASASRGMAGRRDRPLPYVIQGRPCQAVALDHCPSRTLS